MSTHMTQRTAANGAAMTVPATFSTEYRAPATGRSLAAQVTAMLALVAGLWVAISPWFLVLQVPAAGNAKAVNLIVGLAVAALGLLAISGARGFMGLQIASALLGIWLIIAPFILAAKFNIAAPMYWSNIWAGGIITVLSLASLATLRRAVAT
jgi:hypothetical protein